ncbi:nitronate monooxygenase family protein [Patescibacteria group bacterium]|nr:nitronate monooxygenase family protein [Patescibacteria group bacterium]MBU1891108.1 nitronate monooxygenase family protein [Patescibacteria group bacterium]
MEIPRLKIGRWEFLRPLVQGGMGVRVSGCPLVLAVLQEGCLGTLTSMGLGDLSHGMSNDDFIRTSREALLREIRMLQEHTNKPFAVNVMGALSNAKDLVATAVGAGVKIIVYGAGIPRNLPSIVEDPDVALVPIISSARLARIILNQWKRYSRMPDAFIIEGPLAGGHLGFSFEQLAHSSDFSLVKILREILEIIQPFEQLNGRKIPLITAGGIYTGDDISLMLSLGASGVQMGTRFVATTECPVSDEFKQAYVNARLEDLHIIKTPVGMPGRVLANDFLRRLQDGVIPKPNCPFHCILSCERDASGFCVAERLDNSYRGDVDNGLIFCGANVHRIDRIMSVHELISGLMEEVKASTLV